MKYAHNLTYLRAHELLEYNQESGKLIWKKRNSQPFDWSTSGKEAGFVDVKANNRRAIRIDGKLYLAHRVAWLMVTGEWPIMDIDHRNGDAGDNRFANLRLASVAENNRNIGVQKNSSTGFKGVHFFKATGKYQAHITFNRKRKHLGYYDTPEEAHAAYCKASAELHGDFSRVS